MSAPLDRAQALEAEIAERRAELDAIYAEIVGDPDEFAWQMAERFREERDEARTQLAAAKAQLASGDGEWEGRFRATERHFHLMRSAIGRVLNDPLSKREQVQGALMPVYEIVRDFTP